MLLFKQRLFVELYKTLEKGNEVKKKLEQQQQVKKSRGVLNRERAEGGRV